MHDPIYFSGTQVFPFDPDDAKRERYISLHQLIYWLNKSPYPKGTWPPHIAMLGLAQRHIKVGRLKTYGVSSRTTFKAVTVPGEYIENGETRHAEIFDMRAESQEQADNPLLDIFEFTDWFREVNPDYLSLPDNWPAHGVIPSTPSSQQSPTLPRAEPEEPFRFTYERAHSGYTKLCEELASTMHAATGKNANAEQAWAMLLNNPPAGYVAAVRTISGKPHIEITGERPISKNEFSRRWKRWTAPEK